MSYPKNRKSYPMNVATASKYIRELIDGETLRLKCRNRAMELIEREYKIPFWTQDHLRKGKSKTVDVSLFVRIKNAYQKHLEKMIRKFTHELELEKAKGDELNADLLDEAKTLLAKIENRRSQNSP